MALRMTSSGQESRKLCKPSGSRVGGGGGGGSGSPGRSREIVLSLLMAANWAVSFSAMLPELLGSASGGLDLAAFL